jgi:hypothetical protein
MSEQEWKDAEVVVNECLELSAKMSEEVARLGVARSIYNLDNQAREEVSFGYAILFMIKSGELQLRKGNDQEAEAIFLQAKELLDKIHPLSVHAHSADQRVPLLQNLIAHKIKRQQRQLADEFRRELALTYYAAKIDSKAQEVFEEQLQKRSEIYPFGHPAVAQTLTDLARLKNDQSQFYEADIFFEKAVEKWDWLLETPDRLSQVTGLTETAQIKQFYDQASETMQRWANSMRSRGRAEEANRLLEKANQLKSKI